MTQYGSKMAPRQILLVLGYTMINVMRYDTRCYDMSCIALLCYAMLGYALSCRMAPRYAKLCHAIQRCDVYHLRSRGGVAITHHQ